MSFIEWSDEYSVHHAKMDGQHKILFGYINEFYEACNNNVSNADLIRIFDKVIDFTGYHFEDEETLMAKGNYPDLEKHKFIHVQLVNRVKELKHKLQKADEGVGNEIKYFLKNWLTAHIKGIDKKYSRHVQNVM